MPAFQIAVHTSDLRLQSLVLRQSLRAQGPGFGFVTPWQAWQSLPDAHAKAVHRFTAHLLPPRAGLRVREVVESQKLEAPRDRRHAGLLRVQAQPQLSRED